MPSQQNALGVKYLIYTDDAETKAAKFRQNRLDALEIEKAIREKRQEALANMSAFTAKLKQCSNDEEMAECAVNALHEAIGALKHLSAVMMQAAVFWKQMQDHCCTLADSEMKLHVEKAIKYPEEKRLKVWTSKSFKRKAIDLTQYVQSTWNNSRIPSEIFTNTLPKTPHMSNLRRISQHLLRSLWLISRVIKKL